MKAGQTEDPYCNYIDNSLHDIGGQEELQEDCRMSFGHQEEQEQSHDAHETSGSLSQEEESNEPEYYYPEVSYWYILCWHLKSIDFICNLVYFLNNYI